jgi:hypothetical protein
MLLDNFSSRIFFPGEFVRGWYLKRETPLGGVAKS